MSQYSRWPLVTGGGGGSGTVTSVTLTAPSDVITVTGSPVTTSGTLALTFAVQDANTVFAGPTNGSPAAPTFRALVAADLPLGSTFTIPADGSVTGADVGKLMMNLSETAAVYQLTGGAAGSHAQFTILDNTVSVASTPGTGPISWGNLVNTTVTGTRVYDNTAGGAWDAFATAAQNLPGDGYIEFTVSQNDIDAALNPSVGAGALFGFSLDPGGFTGFATSTVEYAIYLTSPDVLNTVIDLNEQGVYTPVGEPFALGDVIRVTRTGTTITYSRNGAAPFYTSAIPSSGTLYISCAFYWGNADIVDAVGSVGTPATSFTLTSPIDGGSPFTITAGIDWTPGVTTSADATEIANAMNTNFPGWDATTNMANLITLTRTAVAADPSVTLMFNDIPDAGAMTVTTISTGSDFEPAVASHTVLGILLSLDAGIATISGAGVATAIASETIANGDILSGSDDGTFKIQSVPNGDVKAGVALFAATASNPVSVRLSDSGA